jgi:hypothetical protein
LFYYDLAVPATAKPTRGTGALGTGARRALQPCGAADAGGSAIFLVGAHHASA